MRVLFDKNVTQQFKKSSDFQDSENRTILYIQYTPKPCTYTTTHSDKCTVINLEFKKKKLKFTLYKGNANLQPQSKKP